MSWNTRELLRACLDSVVQTVAEIGVDLIVVDNGSRDGSPEMVMRDFPQAQLIQNRDNLGFARANNEGMRRARGEFVLWLNSDAELKPQALARLLALAAAEPRAGAVGAQLFYPDGRFQGSAAPFPSLWREWMTLSGLGRAIHGPWYPCHGPTPDDRPRRVDWVVGACMLVRVSAFSEIGGLDGDYFMYAEEVDFCLRLRRRGWQVWYEPRAVAMHHGAGSSSKSLAAAESNLYRGRVRLFRKHHGAISAAALTALIYVATVVKRAVHGAVRKLSSGRRGREVVPLRQLHASLREAWDQPAGEAEPSADAPLLLSGRRIPPPAPEGAAPRRDYLELGLRMDAFAPSLPVSNAILTRLDIWSRLDLTTASAVRRRLKTCRGILSLSERVAIPVSALLALTHRRVPHVVVAHKLSSGFKVPLTHAFEWTRHLSRVICMCQAQSDFAVRQLGLPREKVILVHVGVDEHFFRPMECEDGGFLLAVGREQRDYDTLIAALANTGVRAVVVASGQWSDTKAAVPAGIEVTLRSNLSSLALRDLYARARAVVVPLHDIDYAAGVNALLEAMAMGKAVVVTRIAGNAEYLNDGATVSVVRPGDVRALREAIQAVWDDAGRRARLGAAARAEVESRFTLDRYVDSLLAVWRDAMEAE